MEKKSTAYFLKDINIFTNKYCWREKKIAHGLKQAARMFCKKILATKRDTKFTRSKCNPYVDWNWAEHGLLI